MLYNKKLLFVSSNISSTQTGGGVCSMRNLNMCRKVLGEENVELYTLKAFSLAGGGLIVKLVLALKALLRLFAGYSNGATRKTDREIVRMVRKHGFDFVFIDSSLNGSLAKVLAEQTEARTICFFHNCERVMVKEQYLNGDFLSLLRVYPVILNEQRTCRYADKIIVLNSRDYNLIDTYYKRKADVCLPISLEDTASHLQFESENIEGKKKGLFVGSYFFGNIKGLLLFIKEVLPYVDMHLTVVGKGMSKLNIQNPKVSVFDGVESIVPFYLDADFVVAPIVSGGGMKVKVAEAMMYGKIIIGTKEAFQGYDDIPCARICQNMTDFITVINTLTGSSFNQAVRNSFLQKYETSTLISDFKTLFTEFR